MLALPLKSLTMADLATGDLSSGIAKGRAWSIAHVLCLLQVLDYVWSYVFHPQALCLLVRLLD